MFFGIYFSCDVAGDAVPDTLAFDRCGCGECLLVLIEVVREALPLLGQKFGTEIFNI